MLLVSAGGFQGLGALLALRELPGVRVVLADSLAHPLGAGLAHACVRVPPVAEGERFLEALVELCRGWALELVLPSSPHELPLLAGARERLLEDAGTHVAVCDPPLLDVLLDKRAAATWLRAAGLPVLDEVDPEAPEAPYPLIAKPRSGWGGTGSVIVPDLAAWRAQLTAGVSPATHVVQPYCSGWDELSVDFAIDLEGRPSRPGLRRRLRVSGGFAVVSETDDDPRLEALSARFAEVAAREGGRGAFNLQWLRRGAELVLIDVNPRLGTSATHWLGSGLHPLRHLLGRGAASPAPAEPRAGLRRRSTRRLRDELRDLDPRIEAAEAGLRGLVFDLDDTLLPQKRWMLARLELLLEREPLVAELGKERLLAEALRLLEEGHAHELFDRLAASLGLGVAERERLLQGYRGCRPERCEVYDDVPVTLDTLRRRGYLLALLTDNPADTQRGKLQAAGLAGAFDALVFAQEHGGEKPSAGGFRAVEVALALAPGELGMVGDNPYRDLAGAQRAGWGMSFLLQRPGSFHAFDLQLYGRVLGDAPLRLIRGLTELLELPGPR